jgi:hypothetical protein
MTTTLPPVRWARQVVDRRRDERVRYERISWALRIFTWVALGAATAGLLLPDPVGQAASATAVSVVVGAPLVRVAWLAVRWYRRGDRRYAAMAGFLLLIVGVGAVLALVTR